MTDIEPAGSLERYDASMQPYREAFARRPALAALDGGVADAGLLQLFLMHFAAFGISMTRPVESWISRAGDRCAETGEPALGRALRRHAAQEANHHALMIADLWALAESWNARNERRIDPVSLGRDRLPASIGRYSDMHEAIIASGTPYAQLAVEYEIELLSVRHGPALLAASAGAAEGAGGRTSADGVSFLQEHVAIDTAHTVFNRRQMSALLAAQPDRLGRLVAAGALALEIYGEFIDDCLHAALSFDCGGGARLECRLYDPPGPAARQNPPEWLLWVRALRTQVLFDGGARPAFGPGGSAFGDRDDTDWFCHHFVLFDGDLPVGAARLRLPGSAGPSVIGSVFGGTPVRRWLRDAGVDPATCAEASRLVLHPDWRRGHTVRRLFAGLWALAAQADASAIIAAVGTANRQDRLYGMFGVKTVAAAAPVYSRTFDDTLRFAMIGVDPQAAPDYPEPDHMREFVRRARVARPMAAA